MLDRCGEIPEYYAGPDYDCPTCSGRRQSQDLRSAYAQRIMYLHFGNCGETRIALSAAGRTALVPVAPAGCASRDHVWSEVNMGSGWQHFEFYRSDRWLHVGDHRDERYTSTWRSFGWNAVTRIRGDGFVENATAPYDESAFSLVVNVTDREGRPVDGAKLLFASEYLSTETLVVTMLAWTDQDGRAEVTFGTGRNVYMQVESPLGFLPSAEHVAAVACVGGIDYRGQACHDADVSGAVYEFAMTFDDAAVPEAEVVETIDDEGSEVLRLQVNVDGANLFGTSAALFGNEFPTEFLEPRGEGVIDLVVVDEENLALARADEPFTALRHLPDIAQAEIDLAVERGGSDLFVILSNTRSLGHAMSLEAEVSHLVELEGPGDAGPDVDGGADSDAGSDAAPADDEPASGCGCQIATTRDRGRPGALLTLIGL